MRTYEVCYPITASVTVTVMAKDENDAREAALLVANEEVGFLSGLIKERGSAVDLFDLEDAVYVEKVQS